MVDIVLGSLQIMCECTFDTSGTPVEVWGTQGDNMRGKPEVNEVGPLRPEEVKVPSELTVRLLLLPPLLMNTMDHVTT